MSEPIGPPELTREENRFRTATKIPASEWAGPVYVPGGGEDGYFSSVSDFRDSCDFHDGGEYLWACTEESLRFLEPDFTRAIILIPEKGSWGEESIECVECNWRGPEEDAEMRFDGHEATYLCPKCGSDCAHTPIDELKKDVK